MRSLRFLQIFSFALIVSAVPHGDGPSRAQLSKRTLPPLDVFPGDQKSQKHKEMLAKALSDTLLLVQQVSLSYPEDDGSGHYKDIWFKYFPEFDHKKVQGVWKQIMSDPKNPGQVEDRLKTAVIVGQDLVKQQLGIELCDGQTEAYTNPLPAGFDPGLPNTATFTYFCDPAFALPARYGDIKCSTIGDTLSTKMEFLGGTILHEWLHNDAIGAQGTGAGHIGDYSTNEHGRAGYGPCKTRQLHIKNPTKCVKNADSFLYLAYEIIWTKACLGGNSRFKDPVPDNSVVTHLPTVPPHASFTGTIKDEKPVLATPVPFITAAAHLPAPFGPCEHAADPHGAWVYVPIWPTAAGAIAARLVIYDADREQHLRVHGSSQHRVHRPIVNQLRYLLNSCGSHYQDCSTAPGFYNA